MDMVYFKATLSHREEIRYLLHTKQMKIVLAAVTMILVYHAIFNNYVHKSTLSFSTLRQYLHLGPRESPNALPRLWAAEFTGDPIERFDVKGERPYWFALTGVVVLVLGCLMGL